MDKSAPQRPQQIMLVGNAGAGKTTLALSASRVAELSPVLVLDTEGSTVGISGKFPEADVIKIENFKQLQQITNMLLTKTHKYKTVIIDTLDAAQTLAVKSFQRANPRDGYAAWGLVKDLFTDQAANGGWLYGMKYAPFLSILIVHSREEKSESGAITEKLLLQGAAKDTVASIPDVVLYVTRVMKTVEGEKFKRPSPTAYTVPTKKFDLAKSRFDLPAAIEDVTMSSMYDLLSKSDSEEN